MPEDGLAMAENRICGRTATAKNAGERERPAVIASRFCCKTSSRASFRRRLKALETDPSLAQKSSAKFHFY
jgi:hypothetical protein